EGEVGHWAASEEGSGLGHWLHKLHTLVRVARARRGNTCGVALSPHFRLGCFVISGETEPRAVGKHHVRGFPHELHLVERGVAQPLVGDAEWVEPHDAGGLAPRLPWGERQLPLPVRAVDRVA